MILQVWSSFCLTYISFHPQYAEYGAMAKVEQIQKCFDFVNFSDALSGNNIHRGSSSAQLQPQAAATGKHKKLEFDFSEHFSDNSDLDQFELPVWAEQR